MQLTDIFFDKLEKIVINIGVFGIVEPEKKTQNISLTLNNTNLEFKLTNIFE